MSQTCIAKGATCFTSGDPHYQTFDLCYFDFQGDYKYTPTIPCGTNNFTITVRNSAYNQFVSYANQVTIMVPGSHTIVLVRIQFGPFIGFLNYLVTY